MKHNRPAITLLLLTAIIGGCGNGEQEMVADKEPRQPMSEEQTRLWSTSCALCHVTGVGGAPITGKPDDWTDRLAQGDDVLLQRTLEGYNNMPPLGYCMACEREDFIALIDFMSAGAP